MSEAAIAAPVLPELKLKARQDRRLRGGHLWVYSNEVDVVATPLKSFAPGDMVRVVNDRGRFLGYAGVHPHALIAARIISRDPNHPPGRPLHRAATGSPGLLTGRTEPTLPSPSATGRAR